MRYLLLLLSAAWGYGLSVGTSTRSAVPDYNVSPCDCEHRRLILVRHGAVSPELHDPPLRQGAVYGGNYNVPLSEAGEAEAAIIASLISTAHGHEVRQLCASPRAMHSGRLIARAVSPLVVGGLPVVASPLLVDIDRGAWDGLTVEEIRALWGHEAFERCSREDDYGRDVVGGEGIGTVRSRSLAMRDAVLQGTRPGTASVLCTHKWVARQILAEALSQVKDHGSQIPVPTASISVVDYPDGTWPLELTAALEGRGAFFPSERSVPLVRVIGYKPGHVQMR